MLRLTMVMMCSEEMFLEKVTWETWQALLLGNIFQVISIFQMLSETQFQQANRFLLFLNNKLLHWALIQITHLLLLTASQTADLNWEIVGVLLRKEPNFLLARREFSSWVQTKQETSSHMLWSPKLTTLGAHQLSSQNTNQDSTPPSPSRFKKTLVDFSLWVSGMKGSSLKTVMNTQVLELSFRRRTLMIQPLMWMLDFWLGEISMWRLT